MSKKLKPRQVIFAPTVKQAEALAYLQDSTTSEVLFGGGAGSGKSFFGSAWIIANVFNYPGTRWLIGRSKLTDLKKTTLATFFDVLTSWNIDPSLYIYNQQENTIKFTNKSEIILKDLAYYPQDPNFDSLGSLEITGAFLDEVNMISEKAVNIVSSRIRYKLEKYNLTPKLLMSCNPSKNFVYDRFYKPWRENTLPEYRKFVQALVKDNPYIDKHYEAQLLKLDEISKRRLLKGEWEYEDDLNLMPYQNILALFSNSEEEQEDSSKSDMFLSVDCARLGKDKSVLIVFKNLTAIEIVEFQKNDIPELVSKINFLKSKYNILEKNIIIDSDGVGGGAADYIKGSIQFVNNAKALNNENYQNLKTQCYYQLASLVNSGKIKVNVPGLTLEQKNNIIQELEVIRAKNIDKDGKLQIISKDEIRTLIGRSPDYADCLAMRAWFELKSTNKATGEYAVRATALVRR